MNTLRRFALPLVLLVLLAFASSVLAASGPGPDYKLSDDPDFAFTSPDGAIKLEQYIKETKDFDIKWQIWARRGTDMTELKPELDYPAGFRFTSDSQWLVRMQKIGAGYQKLFLYHQGKSGFEAATEEPLSDLAWAFFKNGPDGRKISPPNFHIFAALLKGTEDAYRWMGVTWPDNRYLVISLAGVIEAKHPRNGVKELTGWRCRYDLQSGKFDVPAAFAKNNARAIAGKPFPEENGDE
ncbi:hypothetical protein JQ596_03390 [Bradyrhizobium manausense]|uniref:hypothetical protein n=1 Tax=Bradyrhizobium TaxID=374 RepID=UPI001BA5B118|nr:MULTISPECIES: hypothetical protein [Bradyrhizobium]MBR0824569.1 hypothetical protein [Bradyrhizobium manausense]UVO29641.1 hypothetical protein KUF59_02380 [Bradyrhizobium arachidis]